MLQDRDLESKDAKAMQNERVAIIGFGLMGGSLGLALKHVDACTVTGYARRDETRQLAMQMRACDRITDDLCDAVKDATIVVLCTPILDMPSLVESIKPALRNDVIITDVGSTKEMLSKGIEKVLSGSDASFIGSHPMAGSEQTGLEAARADLYKDAVVVMTPPIDSDDAAERIRGLWTSVGARVFSMEAAVHDAIVACTSHVPHLVAAMLVRAVIQASPAPGGLWGPGFRDTTRIASGSESVWHDIVKSNASAIADGLRVFRKDVDLVLELIENQDFDSVKEYLGKARKERAHILHSLQQGEREGC
jgi:prephenate dehydrogenase